MTNSNEAANIANKLIAAVMNAEQAAGNRQSQLVMYMWDNEVTYTKDALLAFFRVKGGERTTLIAKAISGISDDYTSAVELAATLANERKAAKDNSFPQNKALQIEQLNSKLRAANMLFIRAVTATVHLRIADAYDVKLKSNGAITFMFDKVDEHGKPVKNTKGNNVAEQATMSGNALVRAGDKTLADIIGKAKPAAKVTNPQVKGGIAPVAAVVANRIKQQVASGHTLEDFGDDEEKELKALLHQLMAATFLDDKGNVDRKTVIEYLEAEFPKVNAANKAA